MLIQHAHKQDKARDEIATLVDQFLAKGGTVRVAAGFTEIKHHPNKTRTAHCFGFYGSSEHAAIRPSKRNPDWSGATRTHQAVCSNNLLQREIAEKLGIHQSGLASYFVKRYNPTVEMAIKIESMVAEMIAELETA